MFEETTPRKSAKWNPSHTHAEQLGRNNNNELSEETIADAVHDKP